MPKLPAPPLNLPTCFQLRSPWVTLFPDRRSSLPVASIEPTFSQQLLVDRYVIALSTAPTGSHRKGRSQRHRTGAAIRLSNPSDRSWRSSAGCPVSLPFPSPADFRVPHTPQSVPACPRNKKGEPYGRDRRGEAGEMEGVRWAKLGAIVMGREAVSPTSADWSPWISGSAGVGHVLRHAGWVSTGPAALALVSWLGCQSV